MKALALALALLFPVNALAEGLKFIPPWHMCGEEACYSFEDAKKLVELDSKLQLCAVNDEEQPKVIAKLRLANIQLGEASKLKDESIKLLEDRNKVLTDDLKACTKEKNDCQAKWSPGVGWAIAGGVSLVLVGVLVGFFAASSGK